MAAHFDYGLSKSNISEFFESQRETAFRIEDFEETELVTYDTFFRNYLIPNRPCLFSSELTEKWPSRRDWVDDGRPDFMFLYKFGSTTVPVANCKQEQYSSHPKQDMTLKDYLDYWQRYRAHGYPENEPCLYLKDWHFTKAFPDYQAYTTPVYFLSDWLNEFWDAEALEDDYRFVYMGPKGTWTPFHADVYRSYSWSANICGRKLWIFYPPGEENQFRDRFGNLAFDIKAADIADKAKYPNYCRENDQRLEIIQEQGQIIFVPSGWHHQVYNLEDTISINHNWLNGCNIDICWQHLRDSLKSVKKEIDDCKDMEGWHEQCQLILKASAGIDYKMFYNLLKTITEKRLQRQLVFNKSHPEIVGKSDSDGNRMAHMKVACSNGSDLEHPPFEKKSCVLSTEQWYASRKEISFSNSSCDSGESKHVIKDSEDSHWSIIISNGDTTTNKSTTQSALTVKKPSEDLSRNVESKISLDSTIITGFGCELSSHSDVDIIFKGCGTESQCLRSIKWPCPKHPTDKDHTVFDLSRLCSVLKDMINDKDFEIICTEEELTLSNHLLNSIRDALF